LELKKHRWWAPRVAADRTGSGHHLAARRRWRAPWGVLPIELVAAASSVGNIDGANFDGGPLVVSAGPAVATTEVEGTSMAGPLGCCRWV
jgi:hypothetical protein